MSGAWGAVNGTHDQIRFYELWNETTPYFPDARGLSVALKNNLDDARAQHLLALRGVELKKIGIESVVAITNAVHRAGDSLRMPRPPHPGEHAPLREDSDVILFPCNTVACATCGNLALTVDKGAARKGHRMDLRAFFANGISRPAKEWALLCEKCETLKPPEGDVTKGLIVVDRRWGRGCGPATRKSHRQETCAFRRQQRRVWAMSRSRLALKRRRRRPRHRVYGSHDRPPACGLASTTGSA